jgi:predicted dehydrogenase
VSGTGPGGTGGRPLHVGVLGLGFGAEFVPIYQRHPLVRAVSIADTDPARLAAVGDSYGIAGRYRRLDDLLADPDVDAVHVLSPVAFHADHAVAVLESGRHCACAVPMATSLGDLHRVIAAQRASGRQYMMMETTVFSREYFYVRGLLAAGETGGLTFYRGFHLQDLDGFPEYWMGYPPMHYITHALSPALALAGTTVAAVQCLGSGRLTAGRRGAAGNPFPLETGLCQLRGHDMAVSVTVGFFQTGRAYTEGFDVYGSRMGVEWPAAEGGPLLVHTMGEVPAGRRGRPVSVRQVEPPDRPDLLPGEIARFTRQTEIATARGRPAVRVGGGHGGSHPHLVHEFVTSAVTGRAPLVDATTAAAWTAPGICAHQSALDGGGRVEVPDFAS